MAEITKKELEELTQSFLTILGEDNEASDLTESIVKLLALPDEQFSILAPGVMQSYQQSLNNPTDKIALVQSVNAVGSKAEDLISSFMEMATEIDKSSLPRVKREFLKGMLAAVCDAVNDTEGIAKRIVHIPIELCHKDAAIPQYAHISDSGADIYALEDITINPGETVLVPTGIKLALPPGFEVQVRPKSGRALKTKLRVANTPGTIDQGYRDEIKVIIENVEPPIKDITYKEILKEDGTIDHLELTSIEYGRPYTIGKGEKFAQLVLNEVPKMAFFRVESVLEVDDENRMGGFGSTSIYAEDDERYKTDLHLVREE